VIAIILSMGLLVNYKIITGFLILKYGAKPLQDWFIFRELESNVCRSMKQLSLANSILTTKSKRKERNHSRYDYWN
jgi:hypothetical protein